MKDNILRTENQYCVVTLQNATPYDLALDSNHIKWGKFTDGPIGKLAPNTKLKIFEAKGRSGSPSGVEGDCSYRIEGSGSIVEFKWDCEYKAIGKSPKATFSHTITPAGGFKITGDDGKGHGTVNANIVLSEE